MTPQKKLVGINDIRNTFDWMYPEENGVEPNQWVLVENIKNQLDKLEEAIEQEIKET